MASTDVALAPAARAGRPVGAVCFAVRVFFPTIAMAGWRATLVGIAAVDVLCDRAEVRVEPRHDELGHVCRRRVGRCPAGLGKRRLDLVASAPQLRRYTELLPLQLV
jgi:hypothetical protein